MQRVTSWLAIAYFATVSMACMDQAHSDRTFSEIEAMQRDSAARELRMRAIEQQQASLMQQTALMMALVNSNFNQHAQTESERDRKLGEISAQMFALTHLISSWRDEERAPAVDPATRVAVEQDSPQERATIVRKVQALLDAGQVKLTVKSGRSQLALLRPIDATDPYQPAPPKAPPPKPPPPKRNVDSLGF